jgi:malate dehydrogenase (oxaloacetate-decarboxylating)(NADP+)
VYIFPAIGLAVYATRAKRVTDEMFIAAAHAVAEKVTQAELDIGLIYPPQSTIMETELHAAQRVAQVIFARGLARAGAVRSWSLHAIADLQSRIQFPWIKRGWRESGGRSWRLLPSRA